MPLFFLVSPVISSTSSFDSPWWKWALSVATGVILIVAGIVSLNILVDPFSVFGINNGRHGFTPNERYNKAEFLLSDPTMFDSFILGSSRMGVFDPADINRLRPGRRYYNLGLFAGTPKDSYQILSTLIDHGAQVNEVLLGLDVFPFTEATDSNDPATRHHPQVLGVSPASYYSNYLFIPSFLPSLSRLRHQRAPKPDIAFEFRGSGRYVLTKYDRLIAEDHSAYLSSRFQSSKPRLSGSLKWVDRRFGELSQLLEYLDQKGIKAFVFIHPQHHQQMATIIEQDYAEFVRRVRDIAPAVLDFNCYPSLTDDDRLYYDVKHYRAPIAQFILDSLINKPRTASLDFCGAPLASKGFRSAAIEGR